MASVTSLDQDMRKLRLDRYTPQAANEVKTWIESTLGEQLPSGDLLDALKDGVVLCKLANLVLPAPGIRYKTSSMPFVQMENISQFLKACELPSLRLPAHDRFLTVDLFDQKDPAQVLQCLGAFSRAANASNPTRFPTFIGPKGRGGTSPTRRAPNGASFGDRPLGQSVRDRGFSDASQNSEVSSPTVRSASPALTNVSTTSGTTERSRYGSPGVSSWSKRTDENSTAPAWNIHQYGYMGGASQANQGISFGARRQIVSPNVQVPSVAEKEKKRKEQEAEEQRQTMEAERQRRTEEDRQYREEEEQARIAREREREQLEREKKQWEEEERRWKEEDERRKAEEEQDAKRVKAAARPKPPITSSSRRVTDTERIKELERQLEEAKAREQEYQLSREKQMVETPQSEKGQEHDEESEPEHEEEMAPEPEEEIEQQSEVSMPPQDEEMDEPEPTNNERETLQQEWTKHQASLAQPDPRPDPPLREPSNITERSTPVRNPSPIRPTITTSTPPRSPSPVKSSSPLPRPLPDSRPYYPASTTTNRTDRFLATNPAPTPSQPRTHFPSEIGMTSASERAAEDTRRAEGQTKTKAGGWGAKSLLEREMEKERERQKEWEEAQAERLKRAGMARSGGLLGPRELKK